MRTGTARLLRKAMILTVIALVITGLLTPAISSETVDTSVWTKRNTEEGKLLNDVVYGGGKFVAVGEDGTIATSADGVSWTYQVFDASVDLAGIAFGEGTYIAVGYRGEDGIVLISDDAVTWNDISAGISGLVNVYLFGAAYGNSVFLIFGENGVMKYSTDSGSTWQDPAYTIQPGFWWGPTMNATAGVYGNSSYVTVGSSSQILTSPNGTNWEKADPPATRILFGVAYGNNRFVAVGESGTVFTSVYGDSWSQLTVQGNPELHDVDFGYGTFVAVGSAGASGKIYTSPDGENWTERDAGTSPILYGITHGSNSFVAVGKFGIILQTGTEGGTPVTPAPTWPGSSSLSTSDITQTSVTLTWTPAGSGTNRYRIYRGGSLIHTTENETILSYTVTGLSPGTAYSFKVEAGNGDDNWSTTGPGTTATTAAPPGDNTYTEPVPATPVNPVVPPVPQDDNQEVPVNQEPLPEVIPAADQAELPKTGGGDLPLSAAAILAVAAGSAIRRRRK